MWAESQCSKKFTGVTKAVILMSDQQTVGLPRHLRAHSLPLQHFNGVAYRHPCPLHSFPSCACFYLFAQKNTREAQTGGFSLRPSNFGPSESSEQEVCSCLSREKVDPYHYIVYFVSITGSSPTRGLFISCEREQRQCYWESWIRTSDSRGKCQELKT